MSHEPDGSGRPALAPRERQREQQVIIGAGPPLGGDPEADVAASAELVAVLADLPQQRRRFRQVGDAQPPRLHRDLQARDQVGFRDPMVGPLPACRVAGSDGHGMQRAADRVGHVRHEIGRSVRLGHHRGRLHRARPEVVGDGAPDPGPVQHEGDVPHERGRRDEGGDIAQDRRVRRAERPALQVPRAEGRLLGLGAGEPLDHGQRAEVARLAQVEPGDVGRADHATLRGNSGSMVGSIRAATSSSRKTAPAGSANSQRYSCR